MQMYYKPLVRKCNRNLFNIFNFFEINLGFNFCIILLKIKSISDKIYTLYVNIGG